GVPPIRESTAKAITNREWLLGLSSPTVPRSTTKTLQLTYKPMTFKHCCAWVIHYRPGSKNENCH
ncbi:MAG: hypothetical protein VYC59_11635, partial [Chloroflexota bacterium]|nr:hypothetical protein [Chloroflexota bacterium]